MNRNLICISGKSGTGKSASLKDLKKPEGVAFANCESGKELPFPFKFKELRVTNTKQVPALFDKVKDNKNIHTIVVDTITYLMDMYETNIVVPANDRRSAWGDYGQYFRKLMQRYVAESPKNVIMLAHTADVLNEAEGIMETRIKIKGSLMNNGVESFFCNVVSTKCLPLNKLEGYENKYLNITEDDKLLGYKYVFQTRKTKDTVHEAIRGPMGLWTPQETFIDNNAQYLLDRLHAYYK